MNVFPQELSELHTYTLVPETGAHTILVGRPSPWAALHARWPRLGSALFLTITSILTLSVLLLPAAPQSSVAPSTLHFSNTNYRSESLSAQVTVTAALPGITTGVGPLATASGMSRCLEQLGLSAARVNFADLGSFNQLPAAILQVELPGGSRQIWVVSPQCRAGYDGLQFFQSL